MEQAEVVEVENVPLANYPRIEEVLYNWTHQINLDFYNNFDFECYTQFCKNSGLTTNADIGLLERIIMNSSSILEVGVCRGRVIEGILSLGYQGFITAIDNCCHFIRTCQSCFASSNLHFFCEDIMDFNSASQFDLILLLWSTLSVFAPTEYNELFSKLKNLLAKGGVIAIDLFYETDSPLKPHLNNGAYQVEHNDYIHIGYIPGIKELRQVASNHGLRQPQIISYKAKHVKRTMALIGK